MKFWLLSAILVVTSSAVCQSQKERINIGLVGNTKVLEDGKPVIEVGGYQCCGQVLAFHLPEKGWFVASVEPFPGYDFQKIGKLDGNKLTFNMDNRKYEIISDHPISSQVHTLDLWVVRITPPCDKADADSKLINSSTDFQFWLNTTLRKEEKD